MSKQWKESSMLSDIDDIDGRFFYIEMDVNPKNPGPFKGLERQHAGAYHSPEEAMQDFSNIVLYVNNKFPGSQIIKKGNLPENVEQAVDIVRIENNSSVTVLSQIRISCIDHRGHTKH